jgi:protein SCO1
MTEKILTPNPNANNRLMILGMLLLGIIGIWILVYIVTRQDPVAGGPQENTVAIIEGQAFNGVETVDPPRALRDFTLINQDGEPTALSSFQGKWTILYFGFTNCPDICPTTLTMYKRLRQQLGEQASNVHFVMISVDPERDTPEVIKAYIERFDSAIVGLQGDVAVFEEIGTDYNLQVIRTPQEGSESDILIDHTVDSFVINPQGELVAGYVFGSEFDVVLADLRSRLASIP